MLITTGENGSEKSFLSGTVHYNSHRLNKPFIKINCANLPETLPRAIYYKIKKYNSARALWCKT